MRKRALMILFLVALLGCASEPQETPESCVERFIRAVYAQDAQKIWDSLSKETQAALAQKAGLSPSDPRAAKEALLVGRARAWPLIKPVKEADDRDPAAKEAKVTIEAEGGETLVLTLLKEEGVWKIKLPTDTKSPSQSQPTPTSSSLPTTSQPQSTPPQ